jgi:hypothetical protein
MSCRQPSGGQLYTCQLDDGVDGYNLGIQVNEGTELDGIRQNELIAGRCVFIEPAKGQSRGIPEKLSVVRVRQRVHPTQPRVGRPQLVLPQPNLQLLPPRQPPPKNPRQPNDIEGQLIRRPPPPRLERLPNQRPPRSPSPHMPPSQSRHTQNPNVVTDSGS